MTKVYAKKLNLIPQSTNFGAQKIVRFVLKTYEKVTTEFLVYNKLE